VKTRTQIDAIRGISAAVGAESDAKLITICAMVLGVFVIRLLEVMFFVGLAGAAVVVLISFFEDAKELFGEE